MAAPVTDTAASFRPARTAAGVGVGFPRWAVARALDAPASTLVVDGTHLGVDVARPVAQALLEPVRAAAIAAGLVSGAKNMVICGSVGNELRLQFFQGRRDGSIDPSVEVCLNSSAAALTVARRVWGWCRGTQVEVLLGAEGRFRFVLPAPAAEPGLLR